MGSGKLYSGTVMPVASGKAADPGGNSCGAVTCLGIACTLDGLRYGLIQKESSGIVLTLSVSGLRLFHVKQGQLTIRVSERTVANIDELVNAYNRMGGAKATRQSVVVELIARGLRTFVRKSAAPTANVSGPSESIPEPTRPSGEG